MEKNAIKKIPDEDLCWNCGKYKIVTQDYREDDCGGMNKVLSCRYCAVLNSMHHYRVRKECLDPKKLLEE